MKEYRRNRLLREFRDIDRSQAKKILEDFEDARKILLPDTWYKENLFSRLETLVYKKESTFENIKKYFSSALAFTFVVSVVWLFYTQTDFLWESVSDTPPTPWVQPAILSEDMSEMAPMSDMWTRSIMPNSDPAMSWSDEDKKLFQEICNDSWGFLIDDVYICILDMTDMCWLESLKKDEANACSVFFSWEIVDTHTYDEILPYEGQ